LGRFAVISDGGINEFFDYPIHAIAILFARKAIASFPVKKKPGFYNNFGGVTEIFYRNPVSGRWFPRQGDRLFAPKKKPGFYNNFGGVTEIF
jgi:hypothetical protein